MKRYRSQSPRGDEPNVVVTLALERGLNAYLPVYDGGVDFVLRSGRGQASSRYPQVQLKAGR